MAHLKVLFSLFLSLFGGLFFSKFFKPLDTTEHLFDIDIDVSFYNPHFFWTLSSLFKNNSLHLE